MRNEDSVQYWRSLAEYAGSEEFAASLEREFAPDVVVPGDGVSRRSFFKLMGASMALAGIGACSRAPHEEIVPHVRLPEHGTPGKPLLFATALRFSGYAKGVLVESHAGRPIKVEGNPLHPCSLGTRGASDAFSQAEILRLYDPDRSQVLTRDGRIGTWSALLADLSVALKAQERARGAGIHVLTGAVTSPTLAALMHDLLAKYPRAVWHQHEPARTLAARAGAKLAFGTDVDTIYCFDQASVVVSLDGDFLSCPIAGVPYARDFASRRRKLGSSRLYAVESTPSLTGVAADHRLPMRSSDIETFARALAAAIIVPSPGIEVGPLSEAARKFADAVARDLKANRQAGIVLAGDHQPPAVHALAHAINAALSNTDKTVICIDPVEIAAPAAGDPLAPLAEAMDRGEVQLLAILGSNPAFTAPPDLRFGERLKKVPLSVHLGLEVDETASSCRWHVPAAHDLESWGDARAFDGTATILQPLIAPLYGGRSDIELVAAMLGNEGPSGYQLVRDFWKKKFGEKDFESLWRRSVHDGIVTDSRSSQRSVAPVSLKLSELTAPPAADSIEVSFRPHPTIWDGRYANNGWLQELPVPLTKLTWENVVVISPALAATLGAVSGDIISVAFRGAKATGPVWVQPGQAERSVTLHYGYGREVCGRVGKGAGFDVYKLRPSDVRAFAHGIEITRTGQHVQLAATQEHHAMEGRDLVRVRTVGEAAKHEGAEHAEEHLSLYHRAPEAPQQWGMAIDLNSCIGCNACTAACQAENNIPVVGRDQVVRGREMHWIRVDRYFEGEPADPDIVFQPVPCMHCENAPCEPVCPVGATVHSVEGLNDMVYNRCVGTRYCSNNCPYKVRRFNFYHYSNTELASLKLASNPDVTVRTRGVMEKCTYCVQRINVARIDAKKEGRQVRDGEIVTACQQACPAEAIVFGDITDSTSAVAAAKQNPLDYVLLGELNTHPRTSYGARVRNPNPELGD